MIGPRPLGLPVLAPGPDRRIVTLGETLRSGFGERVFKVALDGGYTCPNRDGTLAEGGCVYCGEGSRGLIARAGSISRQFAAARAGRPERVFFAYFQAYSGTYAPLSVLRQHWQEALAQPGVAGLVISTRPDCLEDATVAELARLARTVPLWIELGLESARDETLRKLNRAHDVATFVAAVERLATAGVPVAAHLIFGLPQDGPGAERAAMDLLRTLPIWSIKIHPFHIVAGSALARAHARNPLPLLTRAQYVARVCDALAVASPHWVIQRLTGAAPGDRHVAPAWAVESRNLLAAIAREASARNLVQGCDLARATHATAEAATASNAATSNTPAPARHW